MTIEPAVLSFREYAQKILDEHSEHLNNYNRNYLLHNKFSRLKIFNQHLKLLKEDLGSKAEILLSEHSAHPHSAQLQKTLNSVSIEYIDKYLSIGFNAEDKIR